MSAKVAVIVLTDRVSDADGKYFKPGERIEVTRVAAAALIDAGDARAADAKVDA